MFNKLQLQTPQASFIHKQLTNKAAALLLLKFLQEASKINVIKGNPVGLAKHFGIALRDFNLGVRELKKLDFVRKYTKHEYMLNPDISFNGDDKQYYIIKYMWDTQTSKGLRK